MKNAPKKSAPPAAAVAPADAAANAADSAPPQIDDVRIAEMRPLVAPEELLAEFPASESVARHIAASRAAAEEIICGGDDRLMLVVGPCSVHDPAAALEYGEKLLQVAKLFARKLFVVMRVYFEKPRTTIGWKGLINDPDLNGAYDINRGLRTARQLLLDLNKMGLPCATEFLDIISPQYVADLISWGAIGARTTESQVHRELASGLSCPVGFKNGTDGNIKIAADALRSASQKHHFLSITKSGKTAISATRGNPSCHIILRGGGGKPNYAADDVEDAVQILAKSGLPGRLMIDCSHANSGKDFSKQPAVAGDICRQVAGGDIRIIGMMLESNLVEGNQEIVNGEAPTYGQSVTDACIGWEQTEEVLAVAAAAAGNRQRRLRLQE